MQTLEINGISLYRLEVNLHVNKLIKIYKIKKKQKQLKRGRTDLNKNTADMKTPTQ